MPKPPCLPSMFQTSNGIIIPFRDLHYHLYRTEFVKARKKLEADEKAEQERITEEYNVKREAQGFNTIEQVAEWASDYPYPIQRFMRYLGVSLFDEDEDPEKMKMCVKALGGFMLAASRCQKPPSLMNWLKYR